MFNSDYAAELRELNRQKLSRRITHSILKVQSLAHDAKRLRDKLSVIVREMQYVHALNLELMLADAKRKGAYLLVWLALAACLLLDYTFLSAVAEYFASRVYSDPAMVTLARIVIPLAIVVIEMLVSTYRALSKQENYPGFEKKGSGPWVLFTAGLLIFLPSMLVATHLVTLPESLTPLWLSVSIVQLIALMALCVVAHGVVLFAGSLGLEAKAYLYLKVRWWRLTAHEKKLTDRVHRATSELTRGYVLYLSTAEEFATSFPQLPLEPARFDSTTQGLLSEAYGGNLPTLSSGSLRYEGPVFEA